MKLINFGGATALLEHKGVRMLFDPWLDDGIFHGAWYHYPPLAVGIEDIGRVDFVYISHIHEDHCSLGTLRHINRDAEIILMDRNPNFVARFLEANDLHFGKVHLVKPRSELAIRPGLVAGMLEADPANEMAHIIDSALLLRWDGFTVYNANDCQPYAAGLEYVVNSYGTMDLALLPYSGGSGYPSCYANLSDAQKIAEKQRILGSRLENFARTVQFLNPLHVMPFADQYVVAGSRSNLNHFISHPPCPGVVEPALAAIGMQDRLLLLNSGQSYDFETLRKVPGHPYRHFKESDREEYIRTSLLGKDYEHERFSFAPAVALERLVKYARDRLWVIQLRKAYRPHYSIYLDAQDQRRRFHIRLDRAEATQVAWDALLEEPYLRVGSNATLLVMLLLGHVSWNIADAALFLDYERAPNDYHPDIYVCLNQLKV